MYRIFKRAWWKDNPDWPRGLEPHAGRKRHICYVQTEDEARRYCREWNAAHNPGKYSTKAEYEGA